MQETIFYVAAGETLGAVRDFANAKSAAPPTLVRGVSALLRMRLFAHREGLEPYPLDALDGIVRWQWAMDTDFNEATAYKCAFWDGECFYAERVKGFEERRIVRAEHLEYTHLEARKHVVETIEYGKNMNAPEEFE